MKNNIPLECHKSSGIYKITNTINEKIYIGSAVILKRRFITHLSMLKLNTHHSRKLKNFVNKYGIDTLSFELVELVEVNDIISREQYWLDYYNSYAQAGFNECSIAGSPLGRKHSDETRKKIGEASKNQVWTQERKANISLGQKGIIRGPQSPETIAKRSAAMKGRIRAQEERKAISKGKMGNNYNQNRIHSEESKRRMSEGKKGHNVSEETRKKISETLKAKLLSLTPEEVELKRLTKLAKRREDYINSKKYGRNN